MPHQPAFDGFPPALMDFYRDLSANNDTAWFDAHKSLYRDKVLAPAQDFVVAMGQRLQTLAPGIVYDTRINGAGSIFRIYRDLRFSKDKTPYKTFLGIFFWEGSAKKMESPGFYFQIAPSHVLLAAGMHQFPRAALEKYRQAVVDQKQGRALLQAVEDVTRDGPYQIGGSHYKRVPRGYDSQHPNAGWLLHDGLYAQFEVDPVPPVVFTPEIVDYSYRVFESMLPIHRWLVSLL